MPSLGGGGGKLAKNKWAVTYVIFAFFLLSMGGRLYVVTNIMAFLVFFSVYYRKGIKVKNILIVGIVILVILGLIGVIRLGDGTPVTWNRIFFNMLQESLYESYSLVTYLKNYEILNYISAPTVLIGSFINIIPTIVWKSKTNYMKNIIDIVPKVQSPLGGMHFYVSFIADAGLIITLIGIVLLGIVLEKIYRNKEKKSDTKKVIYCLVSANLMFTFYRDPVTVSVIKNILENSILIPYFIMILNSIFVEVIIQKSK